MRAEEPGKDNFMATTATTVHSAVLGAAKAVPVPGQAKRRSIDPRTGRALVILGHAIEYLADEFIHEGGSFTANRGQVDAIQILMALNREIYLACPEAPTLGQWFKSGLQKLLNGAPGRERWRLQD
jgi:hypothetical protein